MTMNGTWGYKIDDTNWKNTQTLIRTLVDVASKGGNFLLNVGPTGEGEIPAASVERLQAIGTWLRANGESIYGTERSPLPTEPAWGKVTKKHNTLYLHVLQWPADGKLVVADLPSAPKSAKLLATGQAFPTHRADHNVTLDLPSTCPDPVDTVIALEMPE
jgi:alpha-L-fucosidase